MTPQGERSVSDDVRIRVRAALVNMMAELLANKPVVNFMEAAPALRLADAAIAALQAGDAPDMEALLRLFDVALTTRARAALLNGADRHYDDMAPAYEDAREAEAAFKAALAAPRSAGTGEVEPFAYAWEYHGQFGGTVIRFNHGEEVNGGKPIRAIPLYAHPASPRAAVVEECARVVEAPGPLEGYEHLDQNTRAMIRSIRDQLAAAIRQLAPSASTDNRSGNG